MSCWKSVCLLALVLVPFAGMRLGTTLAAGESSTVQGVPFRIPPPDHPEQLIGKIRYAEPSWVAFDSKNQPYLLHTSKEETSGYISTLRNGRWIKRSFTEAIKEKYPNFKSYTHGKSDSSGQLDRIAYGRMTFDDSDALYVLIYFQTKNKPEYKTIYDQNRRAVLLYSTDFGKSFLVYDVSAFKAMLEVRHAHSDLSSPPVILLEQTGTGPGVSGSGPQDLRVLIPEKKGTGLDVSHSVLITTNAGYVLDGAGGNSFGVSKEGRVHIVFRELPSSERKA
ncbi:hypothetical protein ACFLQR_04055, partial [Verrucomicrobiota bacterium]